MPEHYLALVVFLGILVAPYLFYRRARLPGEVFMAWITRLDPLPWEDMRSSLLAHPWISPRWLGRYLLGVAGVTYLLPWSVALKALVVGILSSHDHSGWKQPGALGQFAGLWFELYLLALFLFSFRFLFADLAKANPLPALARLLAYPAQMAVFCLVLLQGYGMLVPTIQAKGLEALIVRQSVFPAIEARATEEAADQTLETWMDAYLAGDASKRERLWQHLPEGFSREELQGLIDRIDRYNSQHAVLKKKYAQGVTAVAPEMVPLPGMGVALGKYEVSFDEWDACYMDDGCSQWIEAPNDRRGRYPVDSITWDDARQYAAWLSKKAGKPYRLPTSAEWEAAIMAGRDRLPDKGTPGADERTRQPVGRLPPNPWGLHDLEGNLSEWVADGWRDNNGDEQVDDDEILPPSATAQYRVWRGNSYFHDDRTPNWRGWARADSGFQLRGFRLAMPVE